MEKSEDTHVIKKTQRANGTWRKEIKVKPGYVPPEEMSRYKAPDKLRRDELEKMKDQIVGIDEATLLKMEEERRLDEQRNENKKKKSQAKRKKKREKEQLRITEIEQKQEEEKIKTAKIHKEYEIENKSEESKLEERTTKKIMVSNPYDKKIRYLKKKVQQIQSLETKQQNGESLNEQEMLKISTKSDLIAHIQKLQIADDI